MRLNFSKYVLLFVATAIMLCCTTVSNAQHDPPKKRLRSPATVRGFVGGESQDHYVIRARKGTKMTVRISWTKDGDNSAGFSVSPAASADGEPLAGQDSNEGKTWTGRIPKTGDYLIAVTAHPSAKYVLKVTVK